MLDNFGYGFAIWQVLAIVLYVGMLVLGAYLISTLVRLAVRKALRQHQEWLDARTPPSL